MDASERPLDERMFARRRLLDLPGARDAAEVRTNELAADAFFAARRDGATIRRLNKENEDAAPRPITPPDERRTVKERRARERQREQKRAWSREHRDQERDRARQFRANHPDKVREYQQRYKERNPERASENSRLNTQAWRDRNATAARESARVQAARRRESDPDLHRRYYRAHLEQQRTRSREAARQRRRLQALDLPPRKIHRVYAEQKRTHAAEATQFFTRHRTAPEIRDLLHEKSPVPYARQARKEAYGYAARQRSAPEPSPEELQTAREAAEVRVWARVVPGLVSKFVNRNRDRIREEIRLDSVARQLNGKPTYEIAAELARRIRIEVFAHIAAQLVPDNEPDRLARLHQVMFPRYSAAQSQALAGVEERSREAARLLALAPERPSAGLAR